MPTESAQTITDRCRRIIADQLALDEEAVTPGEHIVRDLGGDSLDQIELVQRLEEEFEIEIPDGDAEKLTTLESMAEYVGLATQKN